MDEWPIRGDIVAIAAADVEVVAEISAAARAETSAGLLADAGTVRASGGSPDE